MFSLLASVFAFFRAKSCSLRIFLLRSAINFSLSWAALSSSVCGLGVLLPTMELSTTTVAC